MVEPSRHNFRIMVEPLLVYFSYQEYLLVVFHLKDAMHIPSLSVYSSSFVYGMNEAKISSSTSYFNK